MDSTSNTGIMFVQGLCLTFAYLRRLENQLMETVKQQVIGWRGWREASWSLCTPIHNPSILHWRGEKICPGASNSWVLTPWNKTGFIWLSILWGIGLSHFSGLTHATSESYTWNTCFLCQTWSPNSVFSQLSWKQQRGYIMIYPKITDINWHRWQPFFGGPVPKNHQLSTASVGDQCATSSGHADQYHSP